MSDLEICKLVAEKVASLLCCVRERDDRGAAVAALLDISYELMRGIVGDQYLREWLDEAITELDEVPCELQSRDLQ